MWKALLENYDYRGLVIEAREFPREVAAYEDRSVQRAENAPDRYQAAAPSERYEFAQRERRERDAWLVKQEGYNPYAHE